MPSAVSDDEFSAASTPKPSSSRNQLAARLKGASTGSGSKRKRADTGAGTARNARIRPRTMSPEGSDDGGRRSGGEEDMDAYDPEQPMDERRDVQRRLREIGRDLHDNVNEYLKPESRGLQELLESANHVNRHHVKQTTEAAIDSRFLVTAADLAYKRTARITQGSHREGVDPDEFVSKCLTYVLRGGDDVGDDAPQLSSTQQNNRRRAARGVEGEDSDDEDSGDMINWSYLGRYACLPNIGRPALQDHLLGPFSMEKKVRKITQRSAAFRPNNLVEVRPDVIKADELAKVENDMANICRLVLERLNELQEEAQRACQEAFEESEEKGAELMEETGLRSTGGLCFFRFVINPKSFGQTVENLFYVSFLLRDKKVQIEYDEDELPTIQALAEDGSDDEDGERMADKQNKHQAIFEIDMPAWEDLVETFHIHKSMIKHRREEPTKGPPATGWYM